MTPDLCIVGGAGHVGLPLALVFADAGMSVRLCDVNPEALATIESGRMPFQEDGAEPLLKRALEQGRLSFTTETAGIAGAPVVVVTIGTPVDQYLNPDTRVIKQWADDALPHLSDDQLIVLRSTVYPGTTDWLKNYLASKGRPVPLAFCPERIAQGFAVRELTELPQLVSGTTPEAENQAAGLFEKIAPEVVRLSPMEAEFAKLFTNSYRYIVFGVVNQFFMMASEHDADFQKILHACRHNYPRMSGMPNAGFTAGPCLLKDTMQLASFSNNQFSLGHHAMLVNEGLPAFLLNQVRREMDLADKTAGILGMAFKGESDDVRDSLSYRLKKLLELEAGQVLCTDPYVDDSRLLPLDDVVRESDVLFIATPHKAYRGLDVPADKLVMDVWNCVKSRS